MYTCVSMSTNCSQERHLRAKRRAASVGDDDAADKVLKVRTYVHECVFYLHAYVHTYICMYCVHMYFRIVIHYILLDTCVFAVLQKLPYVYVYN